MTPSDLVAKQVRELRSARGMTVKQLSARCAELGVRLSEQALYKLEAQRDVPDRPARPVTVDELLALACALDVAPVYLITGLSDQNPFTGPPEITELAVVPELKIPVWIARAWIRGMRSLPGSDAQRFDMNRPPSEARTQWFPVDAGNWRDVETQLEALKTFASFQHWRDENEGGGI